MSLLQLLPLLGALAWAWVAGAAEGAAGETGADGVAASPWADFVEGDFPFFSSVLDARPLGAGWPTNNLTPRGLVLNLGQGCWACFDVDLLRVAAVWRGGVSPVGMARGSYHEAGVKAPEGQARLPQIVGTPWLANGIYPGWQPGMRVSLADPRAPAPDASEVGRGPLAVGLGEFKAVRLSGAGVVLEYVVAGIPVQEWMEAQVEDGAPLVRRHFRLEKVTQPLSLVVGQPNRAESIHAWLRAERVKPGAELSATPEGLLVVQVRPGSGPLEFEVVLSPQVAPPGGAGRRASVQSGPARWRETVVTQGRLSVATGAYVVDNIALPLTNPWRRNVRLADLAFFKDGRAAAVTFDGDVWLISGLRGDLQAVTWHRFASGLHEPLAIAIRNEELFVFDRNGIWCLRDADGNGEAEVHELFSNAFSQTAETREFATGMRVAPDGAFILSKGGQQSSTTGIHNGTVLRVSADGRTTTVLGWGLRMPFIGVNPWNGLVTASDQQGHYVPATPLHLIRNHQYYGFLTGLMPKEKYPAPITDALTWIPHPVCPSAASQVWINSEQFGPLNGALICVSYYRPELFLVRFNDPTTPTQASVVSLTRELQFAPLNGAVNPVDGQLYVTGFQIWGSEANQISGLARVRYTGAPSTLPREVTPYDKGVLLRFEAPLDASSATNPANYSFERWQYRRTPNYGSPHFRLDGTPGQEHLSPSSAYLSRDRRAVFVGIADLKPVMQMRAGWSLKSSHRETFSQNAYFTAHALPAFDPAREGFDSLNVNLTSRQAPIVVETPQTITEGRRLATLMACVACHSADGTTVGKVGPTWKGLFGSPVILTTGQTIIANETYLRQSIREPTATIVNGYDKSDTGMPSYQGILTDPQIEALILYIKSLR